MTVATPYVHCDVPLKAADKPRKLEQIKSDQMYVGVYTYSWSLLKDHPIVVWGGFG